MIHNKKSIAKSIMKNMIIRLTVVILLVAFFSTYYLQQGLKKQLSEQILTYSEAKSRNEKLYYDQASANLQFIVNSIINDFESNKTTDFQTNLETLPDNSTRSIEREYDNQKMAGVFIPRFVNKTKEYLNELAIIENNFNKYAPVFFKKYFQLWYVSSNAGYISYLPHSKKYLYETPADFDDTQESYFKISKEDINPDRKKVWTRVYEDNNYKTWMISLVYPIYFKDNHIGSIGIDFLLEDLIKRIQNESDIGLSNYIIDKSGYVIGHENHAVIKNTNIHNVNIHKIEDKILKEMFSKLTLISNLNESAILDLQSTDNNIGVSKLDSPPWFIITEQNQEYLSNTILSPLKIVIIISIIALFLEIYMIYKYLIKDVIQPIQDLSNEISTKTKNNFSSNFEINEDNEIGIIQKKFNELILAIKEKEKEIHNYQTILEEKVSIRTMELNKALKKAEDAKTKAVYTEKMASLGEMASGIAHEINNPLTIIQLNLMTLEKMISKGVLEEEKAHKAVNKIDSIADRILEIIKGLNQFSENNYDQKFKPEPLLKLIKQAIDLTNNKLQSIEVQISVDIDQEIKIFCLETQILQVFTNLISNSIDAIESRGKEDRWIKIWSDKNENTIFIFFQDSGDGIPDHIIEKMMTPFFTTKEIGKGTGLGLSIIRGIVEKHRGTIQYDNKRSKTTFVIKLPNLI